MEVELEKARLQRTFEKAYLAWVVEGEVNPSLSAQKLDPNDCWDFFFATKSMDSFGNLLFYN
jgi:hypothetical protein